MSNIILAIDESKNQDPRTLLGVDKDGEITIFAINDDTEAPHTIGVHLLVQPSSVEEAQDLFASIHTGKLLDSLSCISTDKPRLKEIFPNLECQTASSVIPVSRLRLEMGKARRAFPPIPAQEDSPPAQATPEPDVVSALEGDASKKNSLESYDVDAELQEVEDVLRRIEESEASSRDSSEFSETPTDAADQEPLMRPGQAACEDEDEDECWIVPAGGVETKKSDLPEIEKDQGMRTEIAREESPQVAPPIDIRKEAWRYMVTHGVNARMRQQMYDLFMIMYETDGMSGAAIARVCEFNERFKNPEEIRNSKDTIFLGTYLVGERDTEIRAAMWIDKVEGRYEIKLIGLDYTGDHRPHQATALKVLLSHLPRNVTVSFTRPKSMFYLEDVLIEAGLRNRAKLPMWHEGEDCELWIYDR